MPSRYEIDFDKYIRSGEPEKAERAANWAAAIGLQAVDGLHVSDYLLQTAERNIEGEITLPEVERLLRSYYESKDGHGDDTEEADRVSVRIPKVLKSKTFSFSYSGLTAIHKQLFDDVLPFAGKIRDVNIQKREWVLDNESVLYGDCSQIRATIDYDLQREKEFDYSGLTTDKIIAHIADFTAYLWQIHPFREGNTRTTTMFVIKYLRTMGYKVDNRLFQQNSWYFRNALVRANYSNREKGIERNSTPLTNFFRSLILNEPHEFKNRELHIKTGQVAGQVVWKMQSITALQAEKFIKIIKSIANKSCSVKQIMEAMELSGRDNFLKNYLNPAINAGIVTLLYPDKPNHPRQKYLLTPKGLGLYNDLQ